MFMHVTVALTWSGPAFSTVRVGILNLPPSFLGSWSGIVKVEGCKSKSHSNSPTDESQSLFDSLDSHAAATAAAAAAAAAAAGGNNGLAAGWPAQAAAFRGVETSVWACGSCTKLSPQLSWKDLATNGHLQVKWVDWGKVGREGINIHYPFFVTIFYLLPPPFNNMIMSEQTLLHFKIWNKIRSPQSRGCFKIHCCQDCTESCP